MTKRSGDADGPRKEAGSKDEAKHVVKIDEHV